MLIGLGMASGQEKDAAAVPQQGVELLFPAGTGKQAKDAKLSKEQKKAAALLQKLKAIEKGGDVNTTDKHGQTALMHAAAANNRLAVCWLVAKGADASIKSKKGKTAGSVAHGDMREFLTALEKEKQPLSRQEARDMYTYRGITPGKIGNGNSSGANGVFALRGAKAEDINKLKNMEWKMSYKEWRKIGYSLEDPTESALLYRIGARKFSFPEDLSDVETEPLQLLRALGVKTDKVDPVLQMKIALQLKQKETALKLLKQDPALLQNSDIFSSIPDAKTLQALLDAGLDAKNEKLMEAVTNKGDGVMLRTLLKAGATIQDPDKILEKSTRFAMTFTANADFVLALIDAGAKADALNTLPVKVDTSWTATGTCANLLYSNSATLLHHAADRVNLTDVQQLLAHGANPNAPGKKTEDHQEPPYGMTPLMAAANSADGEENATHRTEIVKRLLDAGADVHAKDSAGNGVIYYAACGGMGSFAGEANRVSEKSEADILHMMELLLKAGADVPKDILAQELRPEISPAGREKLALMLLDAGADPLAKSENKRTNGWTTLMVNGICNPKIAKRLLDAGVDPTVKCGEKDEAVSAMGLAMKKGAVEVVKLLKEKGIDPGELQVVDPEKIEPLLKLGARIPQDMTERLMDDHLKMGSLSARLYEDYVDIIQILKKHGFKPELMAWAKKDHSDLNTEALRAFFKTGENPNETDENGNSLLANLASSTNFKWVVNEVLPAFIEAGVDVNKPINRDGHPPLFYAKDAEMIAQLLRAGADARVLDAKGRTSLFPCFFIRHGDEVRLLMQGGVDINTQDNEGNTALMIAVAKSSYDDAAALLDAGADPNIKNKEGKTALQIAKEKKKNFDIINIIKLLEAHGAKE